MVWTCTKMIDYLFKNWDDWVNPNMDSKKLNKTKNMNPNQNQTSKHKRL